jgi:phenylacetaldehyde dehydrogenase
MSESQVAVLPGVQQFLDRHHGLWIEGRQAASDSEKRLNVLTRQPVKSLPQPPMPA